MSEAKAQASYLTQMASSRAGEDVDREARFEKLLNPIRDLAQNWNIDVARDLEEYLEELEHIEISFDGGLTSLNFAEAARLIQVRLRDAFCASISYCDGFCRFRVLLRVGHAMHRMPLLNHTCRVLLASTAVRLSICTHSSSRRSRRCKCKVSGKRLPSR